MLSLSSAPHPSACSGRSCWEPPACPGPIVWHVGLGSRCSHTSDPSFPHQIICNRHQAVGPSPIQSRLCAVTAVFLRQADFQKRPIFWARFCKWGRGGDLCVDACVCVCVVPPHMCTHTHTGLCLSTESRIWTEQVDKGPGLPPLSPSSANGPP